ncbi:uncharacterized protein LTR77_009317 [Saxophila tyrrhenica]|uniref:Glycoside hydrolase family 43 protein n=1 Tax=Saxophila tyrrhenica TaxID=1690608 RepID=A0AAV9NYW0_9PEZI|nr:hypothetical protein LTR77_009317 [Saxophila tyrrhenica]
MLLPLLLAALLADFAAAIPVPQDSGSSAPSTYTPIMNGQNFPDPSIIRTNNGWHIFSTNAVVDGERINVQAGYSPDFTDWTYRNNYDALPSLPPWVDPISPSVWAPDLIRRPDGTFIMYFTALNRNISHHCLGYATSKTVEGPYYPDSPEPWICHASQGGAIDPSGYHDQRTNKRYVVYKVDGNAIGHGGECGNTVEPIVPTPIMLQQVADDGHTFVGEARQILDRDDGDGPYVEAPSLSFLDGRYVLFFSSQCYVSPKYDVTYAIADDITGPYEKHGPLFITGDYGMVAPGGGDIAIHGDHLIWHADWNGGRAAFTAIVKLEGQEIKVEWP